MGKKVGKNRRRHARENANAEAIIDSAAQAAAEERALGVAVTAAAPNDALFKVDRTGISKDAVEQDIRRNNIKARKERAKEPLFRSEIGVLNTTKVKAIVTKKPGQKKKLPIGTLENRILEKRTFKPAALKKKKRAPSFSRDLWTDTLAKEVVKSEHRKRIEQKCNANVKSASVIITPQDGISVNPVFNAHQDSLGEAVADIMDKEFEKQLSRQKTAVDRSMLPDESKPKPEEEASDDEAAEEELAVKKAIPERKSRLERNRERRTRLALSNKRRKITKLRHLKDYKNFEAIAEQALVESDKLSGETKKRNTILEDHHGNAPLFKQIAKEKVRSETEILTVPLSEDLDARMSGIALPVGNNAIKDRFFSLERRGLVEPTAVLKREAKQNEMERRAALIREKPRKNRRGSRSKISYWRQGGKKKRSSHSF